MWRCGDIFSILCNSIPTKYHLVLYNWILQYVGEIHRTPTIDIRELHLLQKTLFETHIATMKLERRKVFDEANDRVPFQAARAVN